MHKHKPPVRPGLAYHCRNVSTQATRAPGARVLVYAIHPFRRCACAMLSFTTCPSISCCGLLFGDPSRPTQDPHSTHPRSSPRPLPPATNPRPTRDSPRPTHDPLRDQPRTISDRPSVLSASGHRYYQIATTRNLSERWTGLITCSPLPSCHAI